MDDDLIALLRSGLSPAEALDYWATVEGDYSQSEWGGVRGVGRKAVNKNVRQAKRKLAAQQSK